MSTTAVDVALYSNQANLALAKGQSLLASLLPPDTNDNPISKPREAIEDEEEKNFVPTTEVTGLGATAPVAKDSNFNGTGNGPLEKLRKQLLGKDATRKRSTAKLGGASKSRFPLAESKARGVQASQRSEDEGEEELGRSSLGKGRKKAVTTESDDGAESERGVKSKRPAAGALREEFRGSKRGGNYLDELLEERSRKKRKKKRKKGDKAENTDEP